MINKNKKMLYFLPFFLIILFVLLSPISLFATETNPLPGGLIPCTNNCGFNDMITLVQNIITFVLYIAIPIAVGMFTYAGILYLTASGKTGQIEKAHTIFLNVLIGFIIVLSAWLIINTIANALLDKSNFKTFLE
ncbi:MAG: pilin [Patescibacteria group bacterium]